MTNGGLRLSALDLAMAPANGENAVDRIWSTIELAAHLEDLGYHRLWLTEHHDAQAAHSCPEILVPVLVGATSHLRIGIAGILLNYYSPLKVAKTFRLLSAIAPGRLDFGLARGRVEPATGRRLWPDPLADGVSSYEQKVIELLGYVRDEGAVPVNPVGVAVSGVWLLGTKTESASVAARHGAAFCLSLFLGQLTEDKRNAIDAYRTAFRPSINLPNPVHCIAVAGVCAETSEEAEDAAVRGWGGVKPGVVGTPAECLGLLHKLAQYYDTDEIVFMDVSPSHEGRFRSYELLASIGELRGNLAVKPA